MPASVGCRSICRGSRCRSSWRSGDVEESRWAWLVRPAAELASHEVSFPMLAAAGENGYFWAVRSVPRLVNPSFSLDQAFEVCTDPAPGRRLHVSTIRLRLTAALTGSASPRRGAATGSHLHRKWRRAWLTFTSEKLGGHESMDPTISTAWGRFGRRCLPASVTP